MLKRSTLIQLHMLLAAIILPVILIYFISGTLYSFHIKGDIEKHVVTIKLKKAFQPDLDWLTQVVREELVKGDFPIPNGEPRMKKKKSTYVFRWGDLKHAVKVESTKKTKQLKMTVRERSWLAQMMRIHRAGAGDAFKILPIILAFCMLLVLLSGVYMALVTQKYRRPVVYALGSSSLLVVAAMVFSSS